MGAVMTEYTDQQIIDQYMVVKDKKEAIQKRHEAELAPYNDALKTLCAMMHERLNERGANHSTVDLINMAGKGTAFFSPFLSVKVTDRSQFLRFCISDPDWGMELLTAHVSKDALRTFMEKHTIETTNGPVERVPPGVEVEEGKQVIIRRA